MATSGTAPDETWGRLAAAPVGERTAQMQASYHQLAMLPEAERRAQLRALAQVEYALPDEQLRRMTLSRMQAFLEMEPEEVRPVIASLDAVMDELPGTAAAMRRVALVQTLAREFFSTADEQRLRELVPSVFGKRPANIPEATPGPPSGPAPVQKPWWAFWRKT